jgi:hypothetical protein
MEHKMSRLEKIIQIHKTILKIGSERIDGSLVFKTNVLKNPMLVYVYPGVHGGDQAHVAGVVGGMSRPDNSIIVVAAGPDASWGSVMGAGEAALEGESASSIRLVGWSAGARGTARAMAAHSFNKIIYADPSPPSLIGTGHGNAVMYYDPSNWKGTYSHLGDMQTQLAAEMAEGRAIRVNKGHNEILALSIADILT